MRLFLLLLTLTPLNLWASDKGIDSSEDIFKSRCVSCHGEATAALPVPRIMGQNRTFLFDELIKFKTNKRTDLKMGVMPAMVQGYSDDELNDLAAYISKLNECDAKITIEPLNGDLFKGKLLAKKHKCLSCHFALNPDSFGPIVEGQKTTYIAHALKSFRDKKQEDGKTVFLRKGSMMNAVAINLSDSDIDSLAAFMNSKTRCKK